MELNWMAWTWQTGVFFAGIASLLLILTLLTIFRPETERVGVLGIATTRGDRLFISLLGTSYIFMAWLWLVGMPLWWPLALAILWGVFVFWKV